MRRHSIAAVFVMTLGPLLAYAQPDQEHVKNCFIGAADLRDASAPQFH